VARGNFDCRFRLLICIFFKPLTYLIPQLKIKILLQARPITRYLPLAAEMVTRPGERRRLYVDAALSKGMTLNAPISSMGLSWMEDFLIPFFEKIQLTAGPMNGLLFAAGGRMYMNLSNVMWLVNPRILSKSSTANDAVLAEILANLDEKQESLYGPAESARGAHSCY